MQNYNLGLLGCFIFLVSISLFSPLENISFADHMTASVSAPQGTSVPGCDTTNQCFIPYQVTVDVGGVVTWSNDDSAAHTVTSGSQSDGPSGEFDSSLFMAGTTFSHTFEATGEYPYFCMVHPWMKGIVVVEPDVSTESEPFFGKLTTIDIDIPTNIVVGEQVTFDASGSFDKDGDILEYDWYFNKSDKSEEFDYESREGKIVKYTFSEVGPKLVEWDFLTDYGKFEDGSFVVNVLPKPTVVETSFNVKTDAKTYEAGDSITISGSIIGDFNKNQVVLRSISPSGGMIDQLITVDSDQTFSYIQDHKQKNPERGIYRLQILDQNILVAETSVTILDPPGSGKPACGEGTELVNGECKKINVAPPGTEGPQDTTGDFDTTTLIIVGIIVAAVAGGAGLAISKSRKSSKSESFTTSSDSKGSVNGRDCNVCGTIIPEGKNVCPNCGDTYSV